MGCSLDGRRQRGCCRSNYSRRRDWRGRITDSQAGALHGVRVSIFDSEGRREAITDSDGRFVLGVSKLGTYRVAVERAGFVSQSGTMTLSPTTHRAHITWSLEVPGSTGTRSSSSFGCSQEGIPVILGAREAASVVDAIVHLRVKSDNGPLLWSVRPECASSVVQSYTVEVLKAVARRSGKDDGGAAPQILVSLQEVRLKPGGEVLRLALAGVARCTWFGLSNRVGPTLDACRGGAEGNEG